MYVLINKLCLKKLKAATVKSIRSGGVKLTASQLTNNILTGMYDDSYLAAHCLAGGNASKEAMDPEVINAIVGMVPRLYYDWMSAYFYIAVVCDIHACILNPLAHPPPHLPRSYYLPPFLY